MEPLAEYMLEAAWYETRNRLQATYAHIPNKSIQGSFYLDWRTLPKINALNDYILKVGITNIPKPKLQQMIEDLEAECLLDILRRRR